MENTYKVKGMTCQHCKKTVEKALTSLKGVEKAAVNLKNETVKVTHDQSATFEKMKQIVKNAGYKLKQN
ncbi:MAG: heavy-metal-associated domain-containing protein [Candidatus Mcinerneyibacterium aminivorans]|jgi:copper chaperone|uniref:Heavy-metal-associated domain-containing protein n=1 Tax=Candidatus Mcinerneyibacterium aminivorans TaxID=2703815 RepID=A0A5D0MF18_9BACT|nr:MAG: heavy-metal-associated domain-containing protein [Candidatus Mcinerneyibacterium aminivorans]